MKRLDHKPGSINSGLVQANNYGLQAYGRAQLLGVIRVQGPRPLSEFVGIAEVSSGTQYLRGDYSQALEGYASRWNIYASGMRNRAQNDFTIGSFNQLGRSAEVGAGVTTMLHADRSGTWFSNAEISQRWSDSDLQHLFRTREREDSQLRMALRSAHSHSWADRLTTDTMLTFGNLRLKSDDIGFGQFDSRHLQGNYLKLNHNGNYQKALPADSRWTFTTRWRFQLASQNMDSFNQFSLGGVNGIRAFNSDEGVGDQGAQLSFDLTRQIVPQLYVGVFYDAGIVQARKKPASDAYGLQGAGVTLGGNILKGLDWNLSVAKSFGPTPGVNNAINEKIGSWLAFVSLTQRF
jgi:hemolysin activation/secretion protein